MGAVGKKLKKVNKLTPHGLLGKTKLGKKLSHIDPLGRRLGAYGGMPGGKGMEGLLNKADPLGRAIGNKLPMGPLGKRVFGQAGGAGGGRRRNPAASMMMGMGGRGQYGNLAQKLKLGSFGAPAGPVTPQATPAAIPNPLVPPKPLL